MVCFFSAPFLLGVLVRWIGELMVSRLIGSSSPLLPSSPASTSGVPGVILLLLRNRRSLLVRSSVTLLAAVTNFSTVCIRRAVISSADALQLNRLQYPQLDGCTTRFGCSCYGEQSVKDTILYCFSRRGCFLGHEQCPLAPVEKGAGRMQFLVGSQKSIGAT